MMTERPKPYIGVSGVVDPYQQRCLQDQFTGHGLDQTRRLALGVKAVHKTQYLDIENKYGREWFPVGAEAFTHALKSDGNESLRVAQIYFDEDHVYSDEYRHTFVDRIRRRGKAWLGAVQFDLLPWQQDESMMLFLERVKGEAELPILLQAHSEAMRQLGPDGLVQKLGRFAHVLDYVLFDASHGKGVRMDSEALKPFLYAAYNTIELSGVGFGVAGGLSAATVRQDLPELLHGHPDISWDAEGQLHLPAPDGTRPVDLAASDRYFSASQEVLQEVQ